MEGTHDFLETQDILELSRSSNSFPLGLIISPSQRCTARGAASSETWTHPHSDPVLPRQSLVLLCPTQHQLHDPTHLLICSEDPAREGNERRCLLNSPPSHLPPSSLLHPEPKHDPPLSAPPNLP
jgi:hypothetical protein